MTTQRGIFMLLKSAVTGEKLTLPEAFRLEDADKIIRSQSLLPLAYQGAFNCGVFQGAEIMRRYETQYYQILLQSERQMRAIRQIYGAFEEHEIDYMPLKGCNLKRLYPQPELRMMGDADILIRMEQYGEIREIMQALGFEEKDECGNEITWTRKDLYLELHKCFVAPDSKDFYDYFGNGWSRAVKTEGCRYSLRPEDEFVFIFAHMTKHYRGSGIGIRQFLDLYVFRRANPSLDESYIEKELERIHLLEFYRNVKYLLDVWFEDREPDEKTAVMTDYILSGGNWGKYENLIANHRLKLVPEGEKIQHTKRAEFWDALFPPLERMARRYKALGKHPWMLPVFWIFRWVRVLVCSPGAARKKMLDLDKVTDETVADRKEMLELVGLSFHNE